MSDECIFCKMFSGEVETRKIYEDENTLGIVDIIPRFALGQCLVIHKRHVPQFYDLEDEEVSQLFKAVKIVVHKLKKAYDPELVSILTRGKTFPHAHILVFPSEPLDTLDGYITSLTNLRTLTLESTDSKLDEIAEKLREA